MRCVVYVRQQAHRGNNVDPEPVYWDQQREERLWKILQTEKEIDWASIADKFSVPKVYILQQAAWLYEKELRLLQTRITLISLPKEEVVDSNRAERRLMSLSRIESESDTESEDGFVL